MLASNKRLLVRAEPNDDESFGGYIVRLTELNSYDNPLRILKLAGVERKFLDGGYSVLFKKSFSLSSLSQLTDTPTTKLLPLTHPPLNKRGDSHTTSIFGLPVHKNFIRVRFPKICPQCLKDAPYCRKIWDLTPVTACPVHKLLLMDVCPNCNKRITWNRSLSTFCRCKFNWIEASPMKVEESELALVNRIYQLCSFPNIKENFSGLNNSPVLSLDLEHLLRAIYFIARQCKSDLHRDGGAFSTIRNAELHSLLAQSFSVFTHWPNNFHLFLSKVRAQENDSPIFKGLLNDFGYFYRTLYVYDHSKQYDFMRDEFEEYIYKNWYGRWAFGRNRLKGVSEYRRRYLSKANAMQQLGLHQRCINRLIKRGKLEIKEGSGNTKTGVLIEAESVTRFKIALKQSLTLTDTARLLRIKNDRVIDLARQNYIEALRGPSADGSQAWKFTRESIEELLGSLYKLCLPEDSTDSGQLVGFHLALGMFVGCRLETSTLIRAIFDKKITPYKAEGESGISSLLFCRRQVYEYARSLRQIQRGGYYCIKDLMQVLGIRNARPIHFLVRKGIIKAKKNMDASSVKWLISQKAVDAFRATYVLPSHLAKELGTSGAFISKLLMSKGIMPVSGPEVDSNKQYIFRRTDLAHINLTELVPSARLQEKRRNKGIVVIDSKLAKDILGINSRQLSQLIDCGVLDPSRTKQRQEEGEYFFNLFHVERLKSSAIEYLNLVSLPKAASMLGETYSALITNWIRSGHLKFACRYNKNHLYLSDIKALVKLREKALTIVEAARILKISPKAIMRFVSSGKLRLIHKWNPKDAGRNLFWRKDIEKLAQAKESCSINNKVVPCI